MLSVVNVAFICEGSSDAAMLDCILEVIASTGLVSQAVGFPDYSSHRPLKERVRFVLESESDPPDLIVYHRDADQRDYLPVWNACREEFSSVGVKIPLVPFVPVQEIEAYLLLDEAAIRSVAGKPSGRACLSLPKPNHVEKIAKPKERLADALLVASEASGRRLKVAKANFHDQRRTLIQRLDIDGSLRTLPSWTRFRVELENTVRGLAEEA